MPKIIVYSTAVCPYCVKAKMLLQRKKAAFEEIKIADEKTMNEMIKKAGGKRTVPQIFIDDQHIGGCDELYDLDRQGKLDDLLK